MSFTLRQIAWAAFALAVALLLMIGLVAYHTTNRLVESEKLVAETHEVQTVLEDLGADVLRANNSRRGYVITGDEAVLSAYRAAIQDIPLEIERLKQMTADQPERLSGLGELQARIDQHLGLMRASLDLKRERPGDEKRQIAITTQTSTLVEEIHGRIKAIKADEGRLLQERQLSSQRIYEQTIFVLAVTFVIALCLLGAEFYLFNLELAKRERAERRARQDRELVNAFFSSSTVGFAILDKDLRYRRINEVLAQMAGLSPGDLLDRKIHEVFGPRAPQVDSILNEVVSSGRPVLDREVSVELPGKPGQIRHWLVNYFPIRDNQEQVVQIGVISLDVTARHAAEEAIRKLSARLITLQDQERRRIAREIHDSLGQYLAATKINLELLSNGDLEDKRAALTESIQLLERCIVETRTLSHLLHPPLLDEAGFVSAARWFVTGFSQRSGIPVSLELPPDLSRLPDAIEIALFRVLQESLTNVHRHSRSASAEISLRADGEHLTMEIRDCGQGVPRHVLDQMRNDGTYAGVGLAGMRERMHELGGRLEIHSGDNGTTIKAVIPANVRSEDVGIPREFGKSSSAA